MIPKKDLKDGFWYSGKGRNSNVGMWDKKAGSFWVICINDFPDPEKFPTISRRNVRLKQEAYISKTGTFEPRDLIQPVMTISERDKMFKRVIKEVQAMGPEEVFQSLIRSGIYTKKGKLAKEYGG